MTVITQHLNRIIGTSLALRYGHREIADAFAYGDWPDDGVLADFLAYYQYSNESAARTTSPFSGGAETSIPDTL